MTPPGGVGGVVIVADERIGHPIVERRLRLEGYHIRAIEDVAPSVDDDIVLDIAARESALLLTEDKDFGDLVYQGHLPVGEGIVLLRLEGMTTEAKCDRVAEIFAQRLLEMRQSFTVVAQRSVRIRTP